MSREQKTFEERENRGLFRQDFDIRNSLFDIHYSLPLNYYNDDSAYCVRGAIFRERFCVSSTIPRTASRSRPA
jgi:hypothetical protein